VVVIANTIVMLFELDPLDIFGAGSGNRSVHFLFRGKIGVGCIDVGGSLKISMTITFLSKKVVSDPNLIDHLAPKHGFEGVACVVLQPWASPINKKLLNRRSLRFPTNNPIGKGVDISTTIHLRIQQRLLGGFILQSRNFD
jgi:hypothetical protein